MKKFRVNVDGVDYEVEVEAEALGKETVESSSPKKSTKKDQTVTTEPKKAKKTVRKKPTTPSADSQELVSAQMPGTIIETMVSKGDKVEVGQNLMVLEAMKMENMIKAPKAGTVKEINVTENDSVDTGDQLAYIE